MKKKSRTRQLSGQISILSKFSTAHSHSKCGSIQLYTTIASKGPNFDLGVPGHSQKIWPPDFNTRLTGTCLYQKWFFCNFVGWGKWLTSYWLITNGLTTNGVSICHVITLWSDHKVWNLIWSCVIAQWSQIFNLWSHSCCIIVVNFGSILLVAFAYPIIDASFSQ